MAFRIFNLTPFLSSLSWFEVSVVEDHHHGHRDEVVEQAKGDISDQHVQVGNGRLHELILDASDQVSHTEDAHYHVKRLYLLVKDCLSCLTLLTLRHLELQTTDEVAGAGDVEAEHCVAGDCSRVICSKHPALSLARI